MPTELPHKQAVVVGVGWQAELLLQNWQKKELKSWALKEVLKRH